MNQSKESRELLLGVLIAIGLDRKDAMEISSKLKADSERALIINAEQYRKFKTDADRDVYFTAAFIRVGMAQGKPIKILADQVSKDYCDILATRLKRFGFTGKN